MTKKVGINGFGRIGRMVFRAIEESGNNDLQVVAINDIADVKSLAHLLKYDSIHGRAPFSVEAKEDRMLVNGRMVKVYAKMDPGEIPWKENGVDYVVEATGIFTIKSDGVNKKGKTVPGADNHIIKGGASKVVITAPAQGEDLTVVLGVNDDKYDHSKHHVVSNASCTTNCLAPIAKILNDKWGIESGLMTTIHAYTNDQRIHDLPHSDLRRARAAAVSMIPTSTGAAKAISLVIPDLKGKLDGFAIRVPTPNVSVVDLCCTLKKPATVEEINAAMKAFAERPKMKHIFGYSEEPLVSIDFNHDPRSSIFDAPSTKVIGNLVKVISWYDNEWGYSVRVADLLRLFAKS